jgi:GTP cyclohydrolase I
MIRRVNDVQKESPVDMDPPAQRQILADVASERHGRQVAPLAFVGMDAIQCPLLLTDADGREARMPARVRAGVDLSDPDARGIHMSRLYALVTRELAAAALTPETLRRLHAQAISSQDGLAGSAQIEIRAEWLIRRPALVSEGTGWRTYPIWLRVSGRADAPVVEAGTEITYSSTCPSSAALARQVAQAAFLARFQPGQALSHAEVHDWLGRIEGMPATPHAQRSTLRIRGRLAAAVSSWPIEHWIERLEEALATPVQTYVKRADEQAFAERNARNLMFCEDAARRAHAALDSDRTLADFELHVAHHESLHPHDAVAVAVKGVPGGYAGTGLA